MELSIIGNLDDGGCNSVDRSIAMRSRNGRGESGRCSTVIVERAIRVLDRIGVPVIAKAPIKDSVSSAE